MPKTPHSPKEPVYLWPWPEGTPGMRAEDIRDVKDGKAKLKPNGKKSLATRAVSRAQEQLGDPNWEPNKSQSFDEWTHLYSRRPSHRGNVASLVRKNMAHVPRSQRELAVKDRVNYGWASHVRLTRIARGTMILPFKHVRDVATVLKIDFRVLLFAALHEYTPELVEMLKEAGVEMPGA